MTQKELLYVKTVADEMSIAKAAKKLYLAQPSLSQSIQRLEDSLGVALFNRTSQGVTLTFAGERYYQIANQILRIYQDFEAEISDINNLQTGRIHLGITNHLGSIILPEVLPGFQKNCPNVDIYITENTSSKLEDSLLSGHLDFSIMHAPIDNPNPQLNYEILSRDPFLIACSPDHVLHKKAKKVEGYPYPVIDIKELFDEVFLMLPKEQRIRQVTDSVLKRAGIYHPKILLTLRNYETAQRLAIQGMGITFTPTEYAKLASSKHPDCYLSIDSKYDAYWDMCVATAKGTYLSKADHFLIEQIKQL